MTTAPNPSTPGLPHAPVSPQPDYPALERRVLEYWKRERVFERSLALPAPEGDWVFFEGPPTANGLPAIHHVLARSFKDLFPRYRTMKGHRVTRKGGWDTHGLPVEIAVEKRLGMLGRAHDRSREELEEFNRLCRESVFENIQDWNRFTERLGFWVDLENAYVTYRNAYIESVWNLLRRLWDRGLVQQDYKVVPLSPRISTTLSDGEVALGYREVDDPSVYVRMPLELGNVPSAVQARLDAAGVPLESLYAERGGLSLMVWTTTPWTLPSNVAVAAGPELEYAIAFSPDGHVLVAAEALERLGGLRGATLDPVVRLRGRDLEGWGYEPPFPGVLAELGVAGRAHYVVLADYVSAEDGTGLVHQSPAYGAEDLAVARRYGLPVVFGVDDHGILRVTGDRGKFFKDADRGLTRELRERGVLYWSGTYRHPYPFHDRTGDPILYFAKPSWYVRTQGHRDDLVRLNREIRWVPEHIGEGRFGNWLENNIDWAISRERYWGTPLPFWVSEDGAERVCVGSVAELEALSGRDLAGLDLHRPYVDDVTFERGGKRFRRVPEVLDVWFDSGAMPYAQWHLVLDPDGRPQDEGAARAFERQFPADFICEAVDQTRGWFYSLHAISTLLYDRPAYRNAVCLGHIQDEQGRKMSKSVGNVVDPMAAFDRYGADAVRWYMLTGSEPGDSKRFSERLVAEAQRGLLNTLWNVYAFYVLYANLDRPDLELAPPLAERPEIDRWLVSALESTVRQADEALAGYDARRAGRALEAFAERLSNWYVRRNRRRFWKAAEGEAGRADKLAAYATLHEALVTLARLAAPFVPFVADAVYQNLTAGRPGAPDSVHLTRFPQHDPGRLDARLLAEMEAVERVVDLGRAARGQANLKVRQPLARALVRARTPEATAALERFRGLVAEELNVRSVELIADGDDLVSYAIKPNLPALGRRLGKQLPAIRAALGAADPAGIARLARAGQPIPLETSAGPLELEPDDVLVDAKSPAGLAAVESDGFLVALDTSLTDELIREGRARDLVRAVQQARKDAGFEVSDTIRLTLELDPETAAAAREHEGSLAAETLAAEVRHGPVGDRGFVAVTEGGRLAVERV